MFINIEKDKNLYVSYDTDKILVSLESDFYTVQKSEFGPIFMKSDIYKKGILGKAGIFKIVHDYIFDYLSEDGKKIRNLMNLPNKLGMLFYGQPGTGKTFCAAKIAQEIMEKHNAITLLLTHGVNDLPELVDAARSGDKNRMVVLILDEFEKYVDRYNKKNIDPKILAFLDGTNSRDNVIILATANEVKDLPDTLLKRPGRFERVIEFSIEDDIVLETLINAMLPDQYKVEEVVNDIKELLLKNEISEITADLIKLVIRNYLIQYIKFKKNNIEINKELIEFSTKLHKSEKNKSNEKIDISNINLINFTSLELDDLRDDIYDELCKRGDN